MSERIQNGRIESKFGEIPDNTFFVFKKSAHAGVERAYQKVGQDAHNCESFRVIYSIHPDTPVLYVPESGGKK